MCGQAQIKSAKYRIEMLIDLLSHRVSCWMNRFLLNRFITRSAVPQGCGAKRSTLDRVAVGKRIAPREAVQPKGGWNSCSWIQAKRLPPFCPQTVHPEL